ncbi:MAG: glycosyltransferase [Paracoccaceae bacterium]
MFARVSHKLNKMRRERERNRRYGAAFNPAARERLLLVTLPERIPGSQVFPFHFYREALRGIHGADISEVHLDAFLSGETTVTGATVVAFQTEYDLDEALRDRILARIRETSPGARVVYLDWFAPTDLRFAALLGPHVDLYVKKHVLRDRSQYGQETFGDTNLMDYYGRANGLDHSPVRFPIPDGFLDKLVVGPSFATADFILPTLDRAELPKGPRPIDLHARIAVGGTPWYQTMRAQCHEASVALTQGPSKLNVVTGTGIRHDQFLAELRTSKICFSAFGYGEVCWRDYEAIQNGAVLLKQDMSHVETLPDVFVADETYVPVRWDLSDFEDKVRVLLADPDRCARIAQNALDVLTDWARDRAFVDQVAPIFGATQHRR